MLIKIESDNLFINERLKEISENYFLMFNSKAQKFEVHNSEQKDNTFCLSIPYNTLDARTLEYVRKTKIDNIKKLMEEIDKQNEKARKKAINQTITNLKEALYDS